MNDGSSNTAKPPPADCGGHNGSFSIVSWNVNSVKSRLAHLSDYLTRFSPDVVFLQEIKTETESFPYPEIESLGWTATVKGQKSYNGVAVLTKKKPVLIADSLDIDDGGQARYLETELDGRRFICVYVPNGEPPASDPSSKERLIYKEKWLDALNGRIRRLVADGVDFVLGGDFNVIEFDGDVYDPAAFKGSAFTVQEIRSRFKALYFNGLTDALREKSPRSPLYTYWDYRFSAWEKNHGIFLDRLFLSPYFADRLTAADVDAGFRGLEKASDHAPVRCVFDLGSAPEDVNE